MQVLLKQNWSEQFTYGDKTPGFFVGRKQEIIGLKNIIKNNDSSAILISSVRGVGKTSFVHKALSEINKDKIITFFVNIGHTLSIKDIAKEKQKILVSIIRHAYLQDTNDKVIKKLYYDCIGRSTEVQTNTTEKTKEKEKTTTLNIKPDTEIIIALIGAFLMGISLSSTWENWIKILIGFLGFACITFSSKWRSIIRENTKSHSENKIDDSTDYIEIQFENWLENKTKKEGKKLVFIIDELDKIETKDAFKYIKEYKNLFTRSHGHFIFISSQEAFDLIHMDREASIEKGGIFPTFFTHSFYLSIPQTQEIKQYLNNIFKPNSNLDATEKDDLINYLLFRSGNDFFNLKRLIADVIQYNKNEEPIIDTDKIQNGDIDFLKVARLFSYIDKWFLKKHLKELKQHWKSNSDIQILVFKFLNNHFNKNFSYNINVKNNPEIEIFAKFLIGIGIVERKEVTLESGLEKDDFEYIWTHKYKRDEKAPLTDDDISFQVTFEELIDLANELDDLPKSYKTKEFKKYERVYQDEDGHTLSGINLYETYQDYINIFKKLNDPFQRIAIITDKVKEAKETIHQQIENTYSKYFGVLTNILNKNIFLNRSDLFINYKIQQVPQIFTACPNFQTVFTPTTHCIYGKTDNTKSVMIVNDFSNFDSINEGLKNLLNQKNILVFNISRGDDYKKEPTNIEFVEPDKIGRKRNKKATVQNFINITFSKYNELSDMLKMIDDHLKP